MSCRLFLAALLGLMLAGTALAAPAFAAEGAAGKARQDNASAKAAPEKAEARPGGKPVRKAQITDVQVYSGQDYSRIVMVLSAESQHRSQLLPPTGEGGRLLYVDIDNVSIRPGVPGRFDVGGVAARKLRLGYFKPDTARMVVEVENLKAHNVFVLQNPYRVIVDVQAEAPARKAQDAKAAAADKPVMGLAVKPEKASVKQEKPGFPGINLDSPGRRKMAGQLAEQLGLTVRTVMVDAGHGGHDSGARGAGGLWEKNVTLRVARLLGARLEKLGFEVLYTRTTDKYVPLEVRTAMANARKADLFVSVHCNAHGDPGSSGLETYSLNLASTPDGVRVAARENAVSPHRISDMRKILDELVHASKLAESRDFAKAAHQSALSQARKSIHVRDRGIHEAPFYVLLGAAMPAILVEMGYITNPAEAGKMRDEKYLDALAEGIADGVRAYKDRLERFARN